MGEYREILVETMPDKLLERFTRLGHSKPNQCFGNCSLAVTNDDLADKYVLAYVSEGGGRRYGHALVKIGGKYYDPTLQPQNRQQLQYWLHQEFTKNEVRQLALANQAKVKKVNGGAVVYPPALKSNGDVVYEPIEGPDF